MKRKRGSGRGGSDDIREELKRLRAENEELRRHSEAQTAQTAEMMAQIRQLQSAVTVAHPRMPNAPMM
jgi:predicted  nucleic acid-binding Zn-ribbon protein